MVQLYMITYRHAPMWLVDGLVYSLGMSLNESESSTHSPKLLISNIHYYTHVNTVWENANQSFIAPTDH